jgi:hypothetical protein
MPSSMNRLFAVAARDEADLWLIIRIKHSPSGFYVLVPHPDRKWDAHVSYHTNGRLHIKTHGRQPLPARWVEPLSDHFCGPPVHLGKHFVGDVGCRCDSSRFKRIIELPAATMMAQGTFVAVDVVRQGGRPKEDVIGDILQEHVIDETDPNIVIRIGRQPAL